MGPVISGCMYPFKMLLDSTIWKGVLSIPCCPFPPPPFCVGIFQLCPPPLSTLWCLPVYITAIYFLS